MKKEDAIKLADECLKELAASLEQGQTDVLDRYLGALARFHRYSFGNMMMIVSQFPEAEKVAGFHTWKKLGRRVKKGESGIAILAPMIRRKKEESEAGSGKPLPHSETETQPVFGFRAVHVFDISQTEGKELPTLSEISGSAEDNLMYLECVYDTLNIKLETMPMPDGIRGASLGGHVIVKEGLDKSMRFRVLAHELAHEMCAHRDLIRNGRSEHLSVVETEAEAVAHVVCKAYGIETQALSSEYIRLHRGDSRLLMASLDRIQQTATRIIGLIEDDKHAPINIRFVHNSNGRHHLTQRNMSI